MTTEIEDVFRELGFYVARTSFDRVVTDSEIRRELSTRHHDSPASLLLRAMPTLFVIHRTSAPTDGVMFVRVLKAGETLKADEIEAFNTFYPKRVAVVTVDKRERMVLARWAHERGGDVSLLSFLQAAGVTPQPRAVETVIAGGWKIDLPG